MTIFRGRRNCQRANHRIRNAAGRAIGIHLKRIEEGKLVAQRMGARTFMVLRSSAEEYASTVSNRSKRKRAEAASSATKKQTRPTKRR